MSLIAQQPYIKTERKVTSIEQFEIKHDRIIYLYNDKVVTQNREFPIKDVMDFSSGNCKSRWYSLFTYATRCLYVYREIFTRSVYQSISSLF